MAEREDEVSRDHDMGMGRHDDGEDSDALAHLLLRCTCCYQPQLLGMSATKWSELEAMSELDA